MRWKIDEKDIKDLKKGTGARDFFFKLVENLSDGELNRKKIKSMSEHEQEKLVLRLVKENSLEEFFDYSENLFKSFKTALLRKFQLEQDKRWEHVLGAWRWELEKKIQVASVRFLCRLKRPQLFREFYAEDWILPSAVLNLDNTLEFLLNINVEYFENRLLLWQELLPFKRRKRIFKDIFSAWKLGMKEVAIYSVFPQIEGIVWDAFVRDNVFESELEELIRKRNRKFISIQYAMKLIVNSMGLKEIPKFLDWTKFVDYKDGQLNRHAIEHGVAVCFGSAENFFKPMFLIDFLYEFLSLLKLGKGKSGGK